MGRKPKEHDPEKAAKDAVAKTRERFDDLWNHIERTADETWEINLRAVANITGFCLFPIGWTWREYILWGSSAEFHYEKRGKELRTELTSPGHKTGSCFNKEVLKASKTYRKSKVKLHIHRMVVRKEITLVLNDGDETSFGLPEKFRRHIELDLDVETNQIGPFDAKSHPIGNVSTDAIDLIATLERRRAWKGNSSPIDWLRVEGFVRGRIESAGLPANDEKIVEEATVWYSQESVDWRVIGHSSLRELVRQLRTEYSFSEE